MRLIRASGGLRSSLFKFAGIVEINVHLCIIAETKVTLPNIMPLRLFNRKMPRVEVKDGMPIIHRLTS